MSTLSSKLFCFDGCKRTTDHKECDYSKLPKHFHCVECGNVFNYFAPPVLCPYSQEFVVPPDDVLDQMSDEEYYVFSNAYMMHHQRYYPNTCIRVPRRKTTTERQEEERELVEITEKYGLEF